MFFVDFYVCCHFECVLENETNFTWDYMIEIECLVICLIKLFLILSWLGMF